MENKRTVILADANEEFRSMLRARVGQSEEYTVAGETGDGTEALELIEQREPDLAVIDLVLPGTDGVSLLRQLREEGLKTRVIVLSAFCADQVVAEAMGLGAGLFPAQAV